MASWRIGDVRITRIVEIESTGGSRFILPHATPEAVQPHRWLHPHFMDDRGRLRMSVHALVIDTPTRRIMVDTCIGNDKERSIPAWSRLHGPFLDDLAAAGCPAESIDIVLCTHLHVDHVGWNTTLVDGRWTPTFPRARYLIGRTELEYWGRRREDDDHGRAYADSVRPVLDAGLVDLVGVDHRVCDEVDLVPTLGHTPGHVSVRIASRGEEALVTGDFLHHPCQMARLDWCSTADYDRERTIHTRRDVLGRLAGTRTLLIGTHFATPAAGRVEREGDAFRLAV
jgi:glyoxylase-like metal-dependent hydrolase (beta-lactamase superfamily II)